MIESVPLLALKMVSSPLTEKVLSLASRIVTVPLLVIRMTLSPMISELTISASMLVVCATPEIVLLPSSTDTVTFSTSSAIEMKLSP